MMNEMTQQNASKFAIFVESSIIKPLISEECNIRTYVVLSKKKSGFFFINYKTMNLNGTLYSL